MTQAPQSPQFGDLNIGTAAADEFVRPPRLPMIFEVRAERLKSLATGRPLQDYMLFVGRIAQTQAALAAILPAAPSLAEDVAAQANEHGMPLVTADSWRPSAAFRDSLRQFCTLFEASGLPSQAREALENLRDAPDDHLDALAIAYLSHTIPPHWQAQIIFVAAALQVEFTRVAAAIDKTLFKPLDAAGLCPCCGSPPVAGVVVADAAYGKRFLHCSLCSTAWHHVRVCCISCGEQKKLAYEEIEGGDGVAKAETCEDCGQYSKLFYAAKDMKVEPLADDIASFALDVILTEAGWTRHAPNPFALVL